MFFAAFEPSGDTLAAAVIAELKQRHPDLSIWGFGGPKMQASGADLLEHTTGHAAMLLGAAASVRRHHQRLARLKEWLLDHRIAVFVPVDSPAANWSVCRLVRRCDPSTRIVHLVAPQLWAWAPWRVRKLKRLTNRVLCMLPFEPSWFTQRGVPATFVGHPLFGQAQDVGEAEAEPIFPSGATPRIGLLPGSRASEVRANAPTMLKVTHELSQRFPQLQAVVAAVDDQMAEQFRRISQGVEELGNLSVRVGAADQVIPAADVVLTVSGTATLHTAVYRTPMVVFYNANRWAWHILGRWLITTRTFALPNLIAESLGLGRPVPEFVPHFGQAEPLTGAVIKLLDDESARRRQEHLFEAMARSYHPVGFAQTAGDILLAESSRALPQEDH